MSTITKEEEAMLRHMLARHTAALTRMDHGPQTIVEYIQAQPQREAFVEWLRKKQDARFDAVANTIEAGPDFNEAEEAYLSDVYGKLKLMT